MANIFNEHFRDFIKALNDNKTEYVLVEVWLSFCMDTFAVQVIWMFG
jgi:hypothetical protein